MANIIQIKRGAAAGLPSLAAGEPGFTTDTFRFYVGTAGGNKLVGEADFLKLSGGTMTGAIAMGTYKITGAGDPAAAQDVATKAYVDSVASGISAKPAVRLATAAVLPACTPAGTGPTHTLTANAVGVLAVDSVNTVLGDRILVKNQAAQDDNGVYSVTTEGTAGVAFVLTRVSDLDTWAELISAFVWVQVGSTLSDTGWVCTVDAGGTIDTNNVTWVQFTGTGSIADGSVTLAKMANLAANTIIGRVTQSTGVPEALSATNVRTIINVADGATANAKISAATLETGTDDTGFVTAAAIHHADQHQIPHVAPSTSGNALVSNGTDWTSAAITSLGTVTTGGWHATKIDADHGGTGVENAADHTITLAGPFVTGGHYSITLTATAATSVTLPTTGTLVNDAVATLSSLASVGTITTGGWHGTTIAEDHGGTGVALAAGHTMKLTATAATDITLPTTGTLATTAQLHTQHTDTGTTNATFQLNSGSSGPKFKDSSGVLQIRNAADSAFAALSCHGVLCNSSAIAVFSNYGVTLWNAANTYSAMIKAPVTADRAINFPDLAGTILLDASTIDGGTW
jgi:hypothetical protein